MQDRKIVLLTRQRGTTNVERFLQPVSYTAQTVILSLLYKSGLLS